MDSYEFWLDIISNDLGSWDVGTLRSHLEIEGITGDEQEKIVKAKLSLDELNRQPCRD